jgi:predicted peptidase
MITRRDAVSVLASISVGALISKRNADLRALSSFVQQGPTPPLAPGAPNSPERLALIDAFKTQSDGIDQKFEALTHKGSGSEMPYRLFRPRASGKLPLVAYLHGSGGLGNDNQKQMALGNIFGTRVWALPENQALFHRWVAQACGT